MVWCKSQFNLPVCSSSLISFSPLYVTENKTVRNKWPLERARAFCSRGFFRVTHDGLSESRTIRSLHVLHRNCWTFVKLQYLHFKKIIEAVECTILNVCYVIVSQNSESRRKQNNYEPFWLLFLKMPALKDRTKERHYTTRIFFLPDFKRSLN